MVHAASRQFPDRYFETSQKKLDQYVSQIRLSTRLVRSPLCVVTEEHEESPQLQRLLRRGKGGRPKTRRIMELNADHPLITRLHERFKSSAVDSVVSDSMEILFELALVAEGSEIADPVRLNQLTLELLRRTI